MHLFRKLSPEEEAQFRQWARENYTPFEPVNGVWHPVVQEECARMNLEACVDLEGPRHNPDAPPSDAATATGMYDHDDTL